MGTFSNLQLKSDYTDYDTILLDLDGVLWRGDRLLEGPIETVKRLDELGIEIIYLSNNSSKSRQSYIEKLAGLGLETDIDHVITSGSTLSQVLAGNLAGELQGMPEKGEMNTVFVAGEEGLKAELRLAGLEVVEKRPADVVAVGLFYSCNFSRLSEAHLCLQDGARFAGCNEDVSLPLETGVVPGTGAFLAFLRASTGREIDLIAGKPHAPIYRCVSKLTRPGSNPLAVGDRWETDGLGAVNQGIDFLLVLSGVITEPATCPQARFVEQDLSGILT
jgi:4-nitrophenyl phosphatase